MRSRAPSARVGFYRAGSPASVARGYAPIRMLAALSILGPHTLALYDPWHI